MSALHYGRIEVVANATGRLVYTGSRTERALAGWPEISVGVTAEGVVAFYSPATQPDVRPLIPAQRQAADDLSDLSDHVKIPTLSGFVRETLAAARTAPTGDDR